MKFTLKDARINAGYTQKEAAIKLGVAESTIVRWENNRCPIKIESFLKLSRIYGIPIQDFLL
ncbi:XRE family transcriptional regulator [Peptostreptococcaceae bacterium oral taxon 929]|nr:XRE family transcriptional regulator [Peptostreptococcaceae bacterium oral taxon 929]